MTEPMTRVLHELCTEIDELKQQLKHSGEREEAERARHSYTRSELTAESNRGKTQRQRADAAEAQSRELRNKLDAATGEIGLRDIRIERLLADAKRTDTDLYHYIVELAGHRDTASTKAERVALGHVVERLTEIRGMNDEERRAVA